MEIKIEKGVTIPQKRNMSDITKTAMLMEIGDSFVIQNISISAVYGHLKTASKKGRKFTARSEGKKVRVWGIG